MTPLPTALVELANRPGAQCSTQTITVAATVSYRQLPSRIDSCRSLALMSPTATDIKESRPKKRNDCERAPSFAPTSP
jgi:hypothetical protein